MEIKHFIKHIIFILLFLALLFIGLNIWLKSYTNHGQKLQLPDFIGMHIDEATSEANDKSFQILVNDSIHVVGKPGGMITDQNPKKFSKVKENRKVYVTITKYNADEISIGSLGELYGQDYESKKRELSYLEIEAEIKSRKYDPGEPNHILEVWYNNEPVITRSSVKKDVQIEKGGKLSFVLSERQGGETSIPDLVCNTLGAAKFILEGSKLKIGSISEQGQITDINSAYIISQSPAFEIGKSVPMGRLFNFTIIQEKPTNCQ